MFVFLWDPLEIHQILIFDQVKKEEDPSVRILQIVEEKMIQDDMELCPCCWKWNLDPEFHVVNKDLKVMENHLED